MNFLEKEEQMILVRNCQQKTILEMKEINKNKEWENLIETEAFIGKNGIGKTKEGDQKTPTGTYQLGIAFGIKDNPRNNFTIC